MDGTPWADEQIESHRSPGVIDLRATAARFDDTRAVLDAVAEDLRDIWSHVIADGDFMTLNRIIEASHAVHRAAVALSEDVVVPGHADPASALPPT